MPIDILLSLEIIEVLEKFISRNRPPVTIRRQVDLAYKIENESVIIYELRPYWNKPNVMQECNVAKATFLKNKKHWKVFWQRADFKWHSYTPNPTVSEISGFVTLVEDDKHCCFWG